MRVKTAVLAIIGSLGVTTLLLSAIMTLTFYEQAVVMMLCFLVVMRSFELVEGKR